MPSIDDITITLPDEPPLYELPRTIWVKDFTNESAQAFFAAFMRLVAADPNADILILIDSPGGSAYAMNVMRDIIQHAPCDVRTCVFSAAFSAGAYLLAAGTKGKRFAMPNSKIMIHELSTFVFGAAADIKHDSAYVERYNAGVLTNFADDIGSTYESVYGWLRQNEDNQREFWFFPEDALNLGMVDQIVDDITAILPTGLEVAAATPPATPSAPPAQPAEEANHG